MKKYLLMSNTNVLIGIILLLLVSCKTTKNNYLYKPQEGQLTYVLEPKRSKEKFYLDIKKDNTFLITFTDDRNLSSKWSKLREERLIFYHPSDKSIKDTVLITPRRVIYRGQVFLRVYKEPLELLESTFIDSIKIKN